MPTRKIRNSGKIRKFLILARTSNKIRRKDKNHSTIHVFFMAFKTKGQEMNIVCNCLIKVKEANRLALLFCRSHITFVVKYFVYEFKNLIIFTSDLQTRSTLYITLAVECFEIEFRKFNIFHARREID